MASTDMGCKKLHESFMTIVTVAAVVVQLGTKKLCSLDYFVALA